MTMSSQLWRTVLAGSSLSPDQQDAAPDEEGRYGELVETIDEILSSGVEKAARKPSRTPPRKRSGDSKRSA
jgi:hypothetical protein